MYNTIALGACNCSPQELTDNEFTALADELRHIPVSRAALAYTRMKKGRRFSIQVHTRKKVPETARQGVYTLFSWNTWPKNSKAM